MSAKKIGLKEFVDENHRLLSVFGIFGALTAFFAQLQLDILTAISFVLFTFLWVEVWFSFPKSEQASIRMSMFEVAFVTLFFALVYYLGIRYKNYIVSFSWIIFFILYAYAAVAALQSKQIGYRIFAVSSKSGKLDVVIRTIVAGLIVVVVILLTVLSSRLVITLFG